jgi:hypothetical protein
MFSRLRSRYHAWFLVLWVVTLVAILFVHWAPVFYVLGAVILIGGLGQAAGLWHPVKKG